MLSLVTPVYDTTGLSYDQMLELLNAGKITRQQMLDELWGPRTRDPLTIEIVGSGAIGFNWLAAGLIAGFILLALGGFSAQRH